MKKFEYNTVSFGVTFKGRATVEKLITEHLNKQAELGWELDKIEGLASGTCVFLIFKKEC